MSATWGNSENIYPLGVFPPVTRTGRSGPLKHHDTTSLGLRVSGGRSSGLLISFLRRDEHVADPAHCLDRLGMGGIDLDLASQPGDAQVDGAIERVGLAMRRDLQQPIAHHDRYGFSAKIFNRSNSLAVTRSSMPSAGSISTRRSSSRTRLAMRTRAGPQPAPRRHAAIRS